MPAVWLQIAKASLCDQPLHELLGGVGTDAEVPLDQIGIDPRQNLSDEANVLIDRWRTLRLSLPHCRVYFSNVREQIASAHGISIFVAGPVIA